MRKMTILVAPLNGVGHVNACSGALTAVLRRGHRVIFVIEEAFIGKLAAIGYEEVIYTIEKPKNVQNPGELLSKLLLETKVIGDYSPWEKMASMSEAFHGEQSYREVIAMDRAIRDSIEKKRPDLIYFDGACLYPSIYYSGIPWIKNISCTPNMFIFNGEVPPSCSGMPIDGDKEKFREFNKLRLEFFNSKKFNSLVEQMGYKPYPNDYCCPETESLIVYGYPDELNYPYVKAQSNWFNLEVFNKNELKQVIDLEKLVPRNFFIRYTRRTIQRQVDLRLDGLNGFG